MRTLNEELEMLRKAVGVSMESAAEYLGMAQSSLTRKLQGKQPWHLEELLQFLYLLGIRIQAGEGVSHGTPPRALLVEEIMLALTATDEWEIATGVLWLIEGRRERVRPEGAKALMALKALVDIGTVT